MEKSKESSRSVLNQNVKSNDSANGLRVVELRTEEIEKEISRIVDIDTEEEVNMTTDSKKARQSGVFFASCKTRKR